MLCIQGFSQEKEFVPKPITPETQFLELIDLEADPDKQLALMDLFVAQFPQFEGMGGLYSDLQPLLVRLGKFDRALEIGDKLLKIDQEDIEAVKNNVAAAEGKKDDALAKKWKERLAALQVEPSGAVTASSSVNTPFVDGMSDPAAAPPPIADIENLPKPAKARLEAMMFNRSIQETDPTAKVRLLNQFSQSFPQSVHLSKVDYLYFVSYRQMHDDKKAFAIAEQLLAKDQTREDVLVYVADTYFRQKRELDKVLTYCGMILDLVTGKPKPEGVGDEEWARQKANLTFEAHYMAGTVHIYKEHWPQADRELRVALAMHSGPDQLTAGILTSLAWANYKMKVIPEAIRFYDQCAKINSTFQKAAEQSILSIKNEYALQ